MKATVKIAYIGGGSKYWAREFLPDLALCESLGGELSLYDLDAVAARENQSFANHLFAHPDARTRFDVTVAETLDLCLAGADFVLISIEPGPVECRYADLVIPENEGILQTVGDTTGPGGIVRAIRCLPDYLRFAEAIRDCCPQAWVINYTNPMTLCTAFLYAGFPAIKAFGCCHEVFGTQKRLAELAGRRLAVPVPPRQEIDLDLAGVNHFTFVSGARWQGEDIFRFAVEEAAEPDFFADRTASAREHFAAGRYFHSDGRIASDLLRRTGCLGAAGDRHLAEFVPYYLGSRETLYRYGVIETPYSYRVKIAAEKKSAPAPRHDQPLPHSGEETVAILCALAGLQELHTHLNLPNRGQVSFLEEGAVVETLATIGRDNVLPDNASPLTPPARALVRRVVEEQTLVRDALLAHSRDNLLQALLLDPLVHLSTDHSIRLFDAMLAHLGSLGFGPAVAPFLPD